MTRWAVITVGLYVALLVVLTWPSVLVCVESSLDLSEAIGLFTSGWYWLLLGILGLAQALLLVVPVRAAQHREMKRRHILVPIVATSLLALLLLLGTGASVMAAIFGDGFASYLEPRQAVWVAALILGALWVLWVFLFRSYAKLQEGPKTIVEKVAASLRKGSILELLVAVSCHIIVRKRGDCSAPWFTFFGIAAGVAVMLIAFGRGVFWLFAKRAKQIVPLSKRASKEWVPQALDGLLARNSRARANPARILWTGAQVGTPLPYERAEQPRPGVYPVPLASIE